ncbi:MAG TPA: argininosuccinate lyase, partial [Gemmatales bacterium]|nr:argininosuccinate lyase [Gemmatales bacterium]
NLVRVCEQKQCALKDLPAEEHEKVRPGFSQRVYPVIGVEQAVQTFCSVGSTSPNAVQAQLDAWRERLGKLDQI